jgi:hypothetical protein
MSTRKVRDDLCRGCGGIVDQDGWAFDEHVDQILLAERDRLRALLEQALDKIYEGETVLLADIQKELGK